MAQPQNLIPMHQGKIPVCPVVGKQFYKDLEAYEMAMQLLHKVEKEIKKMASGLSHMKNIMFGVTEIMNEFQNVEGAKVRVSSDVQNIDSDMRKQVTEAQGIINHYQDGVKAKGSVTPKQKEAMEQLCSLIHTLNDELGMLKNTPSLKASGFVQNMEEGIKSITGAFPRDSWDKPAYMAAWLTIAVRDEDKGKTSPMLKNIQFGFQTLNQTTSALSTSTNTQLQYATDMFKQFLGIDETSMEAYQKLNLQMIQNEKSN